ncbi:hypothetical protein ACFX2A_031736 [Malus domestica]
MMTTEVIAMSTARLDPVCQAPSLGLCSSFWRNNNQDQPPPSHHQQNGLIVGQEVQSSNIGIQELFQRLTLSASQSEVFLSSLQDSHPHSSWSLLSAAEESRTRRPSQPTRFSPTVKSNPPSSSHLLPIFTTNELLGGC